MAKSKKPVPLEQRPLRHLVLCDIDHTLADAAWRDTILNTAPTDWQAYHEASVKDECIWDMRDMLAALGGSGACTIVGLTSRPEKYRTITMQWLFQNGIRMDELLMRADDCWLSCAEYKMNKVLERFGPDAASKIMLVIDNRDDVIAAFNSIGVTTLLVTKRSVK